MENTHKTSRRTRSEEDDFDFMRSKKKETFINENLKLENSSALPLQVTRKYETRYILKSISPFDSRKQSNSIF